MESIRDQALKTPSFGAHGEEETPVLIPNTEVKPTYTDSTVLATAWEDRQLPDPKETVK